MNGFLETVHERTYDSVHASCVDAHLEGKLTFAKLVKMYTHQCFHRYLHFQLSEIDPKLDITNNNANSLHGGGRKGKGKDRSNKGRKGKAAIWQSPKQQQRQDIFWRQAQTGERKRQEPPKRQRKRNEQGRRQVKQNL